MAAFGEEPTSPGKESGIQFRRFELVKEEYKKQASLWPQEGRHILAHYNDETVVVYQAYNPKIASYAVKYQQFGGPDFNYGRMSWIKPNFMWMMYRCGWAQKHNQERILAVWLTRQGFENILASAKSGKDGDAASRKSDDVRIQWDPDHDPDGRSLTRRAIQLGLRGKALENYGTKDVVNIKDITDFVLEQYKVLKDKDQRCHLLSPRERVYVPSTQSICDQINLDMVPQQTVVRFT